MTAGDAGGIVVVGASLAGLRAAETLRAEGFDGPVTLIGAESRQPYDRPPLSKRVLPGEWEPDRVALRQPDALGALGLDIRLGAPAVGLDLDARCVTLADGTEVTYGDGVIVATGSTPRHLPGHEDTPNVQVLRTMDDALALRERIADGTSRVVVIGAGFIGLEVAATARAKGCAVTVLEGLPGPLVRGLGAEMGVLATAAHGRDGIDIRCGVAVADIDAGGVVLADGARIDADVVVVGIGVVPATDWLASSGLDVRDGVVCDENLAAAPGVYAAGDIARWTNPLYGEEMRVEHWTNAAEQGAAAARNLLAVSRGETPTPYAAVPFFWSDQHRHRIQFLGRSATDADDQVEVAVGDPAEDRFLALYRRGDRLWGALGVNVPKLVMPFKRLLESRVSWDDARAHAATLSL